MSSARRMGIGSISLAAIAWLLVLIGLAVQSPHETASVAVVVAISGAAVAHEAARHTSDPSPKLLRWGWWLNVSAVVASAVLISYEMALRTGIL